MQDRRRRRSPGLAAFAALALAVAARAQEGEFVTSGGLSAPTPPVETLDCAGLRRALATLDAIGYRRGGPDSVDPVDAPLLDYENRLARAHHALCARDPAAALEPSEAFEQGFAAEGGR